VLSVSLGGVIVSWSADGLAADPLADTLRLLDPRPADPGEAPAIRFDLRPARDREGPRADPRAEGWAPSFFHGAMQAYHRGGAFLLDDGASHVIVPAAGSPVEAAIAPPDREPLPASAASMLQIALYLALRHAGLFHLHAAALERAGGDVVIVVGASGAGKTTTALALLEAGAGYLGDDTVLLAEGPGGVELVAFPREFHLGDATLAAFPRLSPLAGAPSAQSGKRPVDPRAAFPGRHRARVPARRGHLLAIFPSVGGEPETRVGPIPLADALGHLFASSAALIVDGVHRRDDNLARIRALLGAARCVELRLGRDALADPAGVIAARLGEALDAG
jgi:hypothetical protein